MRSLLDFTDYKLHKIISGTDYELHDFSKDPDLPHDLIRESLASSSEEVFPEFPEFADNENDVEVPTSSPSEAEGTPDSEVETVEAEESSDQWPTAEAETALAEAGARALILIEKANATAEEIVKNANEKAAAIESAAKEEGRQQGYDEGLKEGKEQGVFQGYQEMSEKYTNFFSGMTSALQDIDRQKKEMEEKYLNQLTDLAMSVAEKVIHVSLQSSGYVIRSMILAALEHSRGKQWGRVFISAADDAKMKEDGIDVQEMLRDAAPDIKIEVLEDGEPGTCLIEFPDQIIDSSVRAQLRNIREITGQFNAENIPKQEERFVL